MIGSIIIDMITNATFTLRIDLLCVIILGVLFLESYDHDCHVRWDYNTRNTMTTLRMPIMFTTILNNLTNRNLYLCILNH